MQPTELKNAPTISPVRTIKNIFRFVKNPITVLNEYLQLGGDTFCLYLGIGNKAMVTTNPKLIRHVLQKNHRNYRKSPLVVEQLAHFIGRGLLTSEGAYWLQQRRLIQPGFHREKLIGLMEILVREIDDYVRNLEIRSEMNVSVDMAEEMTELTFNLVAKSLFSSDIEKGVLDQLSRDFNNIQAFMARQIRLPFLRSWFKFTGEFKKHEEIARSLKGIVLNIIHQRKESEQDHDDLLSMLMNARYEDSGKGMTDQQLLEESLILLIAGHETTANALAWSWYLLSQHPQVVDQIRKEIDEVLGHEELTFQILPRLKYLNAVLQEAMRLFPPAWITERIPINDDQFEGMILPKNRIIGIYIYGVHHAPEYWPDPEKFDPSRWMGDKKKNQIPFSYLPFGGGPRLCIGNNFAMMEMQLLMIRMIPRFDLQLSDEYPVENEPLITLRPKNGVHIRLSRRSF